MAIKSGGMSRLPNLRDLRLVRLISRRKPFKQNSKLNCDQLEVRKAGMPPLMIAIQGDVFNNHWHYISGSSLGPPSEQNSAAIHVDGLPVNTSPIFRGQ
jgi:hypothetical protein